MRKIIGTITLVSLFSAVSFASFSTNDAGTSGAQFLKLGAGARAAAMGGAFAGMADDSTAIYWNPAGLGRIDGGSISLMHAIWFEDTTYDWISFAHKLGNCGTIGIGAQYLSYGNIMQTDSTGLEMGNFTPADEAVTLSYATSIRSLLVGISVKYIQLKILNTASAYAGDIGIMCPVGDRFWLGLAVQNAGTKLKFDTEEDPLPTNVKLGCAYALTNSWKLAVDANAPVDNAINAGAGTEYVCKVSESISAAGRVGYNTTAKDTGGLNGVSAGIGITCSSYTIDYAFVPYGDLGNTQRISLSIKF